MRKKVTVVGAGNVGATTAQRIVDKGYADVVLVDVIEGLPQGKALDMLEATPVVGSDARIIGTNSYDDTRDSNIVIITAGVPRKPGMSRDDLLLTNMNIIGSITKEIIQRSPNCVLILVTNPLDAMVQHALEVSGFPRHRVLGMAGILDTSRFRTFIAQKVNASVEDVQALVFGSHGDDMVPLVRQTSVGGIPLEEILSSTEIQQLVERTRTGGSEIVNLLKAGSAYYAPSAAITQMAEAILLDKKRILPCCVFLNGEYGISGVCVGVAIKLGSEGLEEIMEIQLTDEEQTALHKAADSVKELVTIMHKSLKTT